MQASLYNAQPSIKTSLQLPITSYQNRHRIPLSYILYKLWKIVLEDPFTYRYPIRKQISITSCFSIKIFRNSVGFASCSLVFLESIATCTKSIRSQLGYLFNAVYGQLSCECIFADRTIYWTLEPEIEYRRLQMHKISDLTIQKSLRRKLRRWKYSFHNGISGFFNVKTKSSTNKQQQKKKKIEIFENKK